MKIRAAALAAASLSLAGALTAGPAIANGAYNVTADGQASGQPLAGLPTTSTVTLAISNLPAGTGLYALHCLVPANPQAAPTRCDAGRGTLAYILASDSYRPALEQELVVNRVFTGSNPNPQQGDTGTRLVNCLQQSCSIYVLGAGQASANPQWIRIFPTAFATPPARARDKATVTLRGKTLHSTRTPVVSNSEASPLRITLQSGITPTVTSTRCQVNNGTVRALKTSGVCTVEITSPGNEQYRPFSRTLTFRLAR